jgi:hypothetical protein
MYNIIYNIILYIKHIKYYTYITYIIYTYNILHILYILYIICVYVWTFIYFIAFGSILKYCKEWDVKQTKPQL